MDIEGILAYKYLGNHVADYLQCAGILLIGYICRNIFSKYFSKLCFVFFRKFSENKFPEEFVGLLKSPIKVFFSLCIVYFAFVHLNFPPHWNRQITKKWDVDYLLNTVYGLFLTLSITWILLRAVDFVTMVLLERARIAEAKSDWQIVGYSKELIKFLLVILSLLFIMGGIFNVNIGALVTGLGLGGLAIAIAAHETLSNLLGSFIIFTDKPFKAGDLVQVNDINGVIEKVGFRSTRIRTLDKSLLTVPNKTLIENPLNNITLSSFRRVKFTVGLLYSTKAAQLKQVCAEISDALKNHTMVDDDFSVKFSEYGESALKINVIFFVPTNNWDIMMDVKEEINFRVMEIVENNGCQFAFPTQTVHVAKEE